MCDRTLPRHLLVASLLLLQSCARTTSDSDTVLSLSTGALEPIPIETSLPWPTLRWPASFLVERTDRFLWAEGSELFQIELSASGVDVAPWSERNLASGLDRIVGAAQSADGTIAVLDVSGRVAISNPRSEERWGLETPLRNRAAKLAVMDGRVFFLLTDDSEGGSAVVA